MRKFLIFSVFSITLSALLSVAAFAQNNKEMGTPKLDKFIENAFNAVKKKNWPEATKNFNEALKEKSKIKYPSYFLYQLLVLPDEDRSTDISDIDVVQITFWRHSMGHEQALLTFLAFTEQLDGNTLEADRAMQKVYGMQSPVWGLSWKMFAGKIHDVFFALVPKDLGENYARYLFQSGNLLIDAEDMRGIELVERAQELLPKDPEIAGRLADIYLMTDKIEESKRLAEMSLSIKPKQLRVLIDLANAEWILGNIDAAEKIAKEAIAIDAEFPGPHSTLVFIAIEKGEFSKALEQAKIGSKLSNKHIFYQTVLAAALAANGQQIEAQNVMKESWQNEPPSVNDLKHWFFRRKPLELIRGLYDKKSK